MPTPQIQNDLIIETPFLYMYGFPIVISGATNTFTVGAGQCRDSNNVVDISLGTLFPPGNQTSAVSTPITVSGTSLGYNGVDVLPLQANIWYSVYAISDSRGFHPTGAIISLSTNSIPKMPFGYDSYRLIGYVRTDSTPNFVEMEIFGNSNDRTYVLHSPISVLTNGTSTTFAPIDCSTALPGFGVINTNVNYVAQVNFTPTTAGNKVQFNPEGSTFTLFTQMSGVVAAVEQDLQLELLTGNNFHTDYKITGSGGTVSVSILSFEIDL